jgi:glycosyltransferase involved in cell wall biosynthesis
VSDLPRIVYLKAGGVLAPGGEGAVEEQAANLVERVRTRGPLISSSTNIITELRCRRIVDAEAWWFWDGPSIRFEGDLPVQLLPASDAEGSMRRLSAERGTPDVLWVEGNRHPGYLDVALASCPGALKVYYSQASRPWRLPMTSLFDLCLVDEAWQAEAMQQHLPNVEAAIWDKLIDYETTHYPIDCEKRYDVCYVAYLTGRKKHERLLRALSKLRERKLSGLLVGQDHPGRRQALSDSAAAWGVPLHFSGEVTKAEVNVLINASRIGAMCSRSDAAPRALLEYMAADVPVLVASDLRAGTRYVTAEAGLIRDPEQLHEGIIEILENYDRFSPRASFLERFNKDAVIRTILAIFEDVGLRFRAPSTA